jgi:glycosyltransferase involved in cell wall biosynthesis
MEQTLGNITHYLNLRHAAAEQPGPLPHWLPIDFRPSKVPWTITGGWLARQALAPVLNDVDGVFIHTMTLALGSVDLFEKKPFVLSGDATPYAKRHMRSDYGMASQRAVSEALKRSLYRQMLKRARGFVVWSTWVQRSLVRDYGCREADIAVIPPGVDVTSFAPGTREHTRPRILFVGGDFVRKGGDLLLDVYRRHLRGCAELVIVTRDRVEPEPGVTVFNEVDANSNELRALYASCDVFALPTRADCYALVCMEAMAAGMPVVTTRVGGIPDLVLDGQTGHLVDVDDENALVRVLRSLCNEPGKRAEFGARARQRALTSFDATVNARSLFEFVRTRCTR